MMVLFDQEFYADIDKKNMDPNFESLRSMDSVADPAKFPKYKYDPWWCFFDQKFGTE
jgi:hypothetical protein